MVDTYGGAARHGGGAFSGKDPSKVDRSGAYGARWAAKHVVAAGLARRCEIAVAYAIGVSEPVAIQVETFGTANIPEERITQAVRKVFDFRPQALIEQLRLDAPIYRPTAVYGHFGRQPYTARVAGRDHRFFTWEELDRLDELQAAV
jgi:S-adenosylmethionine synthetase